MDETLIEVYEIHHAAVARFRRALFAQLDQLRSRPGPPEARP